MADLTSLVAGGAKSLLKDKASEFMSPQQMELARFALSPQAYLADKGIAAVANLLGYGDQYKQLKAGAEDEKAYGKEVIRDTIGDALPNSIGDFVRATPRNTENNNTPAGTYTAWDPETQSWTQQASANPVGSSDPFAGARFDAGINPNSQYNPASDAYMGAKPPSIQNEVDLLDILDPYRAQAVPEMTIDGAKESASEGYHFDPNTGTAVPIDFGGTMDYGDMFGGGGGGGKYMDAQDAYKRGGQICGCKH